MNYKSNKKKISHKNDDIGSKDSRSLILEESQTSQDTMSDQAEEIDNRTNAFSEDYSIIQFIDSVLLKSNSIATTTVTNDNDRANYEKKSVSPDLASLLKASDAQILSESKNFNQELIKTTNFSSLEDHHQTGRQIIWETKSANQYHCHLRQEKDSLVQSSFNTNVDTVKMEKTSDTRPSKRKR